MEPTTQTTAPLPPRSVPVMDVQAPRQSPSVRPVSDVVTDTPVAEPTPPEVVTAPVEETDVPVSEAPAEEEATSTEVTATDTQSAPEAPANNPMAVTPDNAGSAPLRHKAPIGAIIAAIVIALLLAAATIFAYLRSSKDTTATSTKFPTTAASTATQPQLKASDIEQTSQGIDDSIKSIDNNKDFSSTDLSDTTLGL